MPGGSGFLLCFIILGKYQSAFDFSGEIGTGFFMSKPFFVGNRDASKAMAGRNPSGPSYGGFGAMGGPVGGASAVDRGYGRSMGGYAGLGIGNPSSYGGRGGGGSGGRDSGGFGSNDGNRDTAGNAGFGR